VVFVTSEDFSTGVTYTFATENEVDFFINECVPENMGFEFRTTCLSGVTNQTLLIAAEGFAKTLGRELSRDHERAIMTFYAKVRLTPRTAPRLDCRPL